MNEQSQAYYAETSDCRGWNVFRYVAPQQKAIIGTFQTRDEARRFCDAANAPETGGPSHSVLPWRANGPQITARGEWHCPVATFLSRADRFPTADAVAVTREEADANRDFVLLAVNSYDDMRAALKLCAETLRPIGNAAEHAAVIAANRALARAEGRT